MKLRRPYALAALDMNYRTAQNLRADLLVASRLGDRKGIREICRGFVAVLRDTISLLEEASINPPEPLIEYEKLRQAFRTHQEAIKSMYSDPTSVSDEDFAKVSEAAETGTRVIRLRAKRFLKYMERYFPDLLTTSRHMALERMSTVPKKE